tara:strand:- start:46 stop:702 length:657 start_codon:yes stop_codon:yes gene_type:complete
MHSKMFLLLLYFFINHVECHGNFLRRGTPFDEVASVHSVQFLRSTIQSIFPPPTALQTAAIQSIEDDANENKQALEQSRIVLNTAIEATKITPASLKPAAAIAVLIQLQSDPCKPSDAKPTPFELKKQGKDIAIGDKLRKYDNPCKPPPFLAQAELQAPGLPAIPVAPPLEMSSLFGINPFDQSSQPSNGLVTNDLEAGNKEGLALANAVLNGMSTYS